MSRICCVIEKGKSGTIEITMCVPTVGRAALKFYKRQFAGSIRFDNKFTPVSINAKLYRNVLMVTVANAGRYDKYVFRFDKDFTAHDVRTLTDVPATDIEFTVLDTGVVLHLSDDDRLEVFSSVKDSMRISVLEDEALQDDLKLFHTGKQALMAKGRKLYKFKLQT